MKICHLSVSEVRQWQRNVPILVFTDTGEAVLVDGKPRNITAAELAEVFKSQRRKKLFSVKVDGRDAHFVSGRSYMARELARAHKGPVQLRMPNRRILANIRPKTATHDLLRSPCQPIESERPYAPAVRELSTGMALVQGRPVVVPPPAGCPKCGDWLKPIGCREDDHHPICEHFEPWKKVRLAMEAEIPRKPAAPENTPATKEVPPAADAQLFVIDTKTGEVLRSATVEEIAEAEKATETTGMPIIDIGGTPYAIATENLVAPDAGT